MFPRNPPRSSDLPSREVSEEEFIRLIMAEGSVRDEDEARMQAKLNKGLGGQTQVGQELLIVKTEK